MIETYCTEMYIAPFFKCLFLRCVIVQVESPDTYCSKSEVTLFHWPGRRNRI